MVLTLSIMLIIVAFSLYDYFSSKSWQMVTSRERNETVFENRNKEYGAYKNRRDYDKRILLIFLGMTVGIGGIWAASNMFKPLEKKKDPTITAYTWPNETMDDEKEPEIPEPEVEQVAAVETLQDIVKFVEPVVTDEPDIEPTNIIDPNQIVGAIDQKGDDDEFWDKPIIAIKGTPKTGGTIEIPVDDTPVDVVDEPAKFPGGMDALRQFIADNIDINSIDGSAKVSLKFVVDTDGSISSVVVTKTTDDCKTCEKAAIKVVKAMPKWTPGKVNGREVRSYYRLPINIQ
ncbi:energy transducer TonB [Fluviicola taffensis]|uniref:TonB family protein n=1 Tax=Fluviicola taffensis (strain DSM 16823 / NCIMB 13979 / RW262) TaxID=755732 RepID=F2IAH4_FLUTR|nr:energy transducer TonB [Fluviicola taffensis]AEA43110.1 TonB family protein [Fluviicola taffensis DSM 16823]